MIFQADKQAANSLALLSDYTFSSSVKYMVRERIVEIAQSKSGGLRESVHQRFLDGSATSLESQ